MPVLQLPAGDQHRRELVIDGFVRRQRQGGRELPSPGGGREARAEHDVQPGRVVGRAGIGDRVLALDPLPVDVVEGLHAALHFGKHVARVVVVPAESEAPGDLLDDPPVRAGLARRRQRRAPHLHLAVGVGDGAVLLGPAGRRQDDVRELRGLGHEQVLHDQVFEPGERRAGVVQVRVRHRGILAQDVHAADRAGMNRVHGFHDRQARPGIQRRVPQLLEGGAVLRVAYRVVIGEHHRDQSRVRGALHVVLAAQGVQAGSRAADLARGERQRDQAARVVGAVHVLGDAHAPEDHGASGRGVGAGDVADLVRRDAAQGRHRLGRERQHVRAQQLEALGVGGDVVLVEEPFADDDVEHRVQQRHVRARRESQHAVRVVAQHLAPRVEHDQLRSALGGLLEVGRRDRVVDGRVAAGQDRDVRMRDLHERRGHRAGTDAFHERGHRAGVAQARAVIHVVRAEAGAHQLLEQPGLLVRAFRAAEARQRRGAPLVAQRLQAAGGKVQRFLPAGLAEMRQWPRRVEPRVDCLGHAVQADQRPVESRRVLQVVEAEASLDAQATFVGRTVAPLDVDDAPVLDVVGQLAADATVGAHGIDPAFGDRRIAAARRVDQARRHQRAGRAGLHALAAGDAAALAHAVVEIEHDPRCGATVGQPDDVIDLHFAAGAHAQRALDAGVQVDVHGGVRPVPLRRARRPRRQGPARHRRVEAELLDRRPEMAGAIRRAGPIRLVGQQQLHHAFARDARAGRAGAFHDHARRRLAHAAGGQRPLALDLDHAGAAVAVGAIARGVLQAQVGDALAGALRDLPQRLARARGDGSPVERQLEAGAW